MATYVDGFVIPVPQGKLDDYKKMATKACAVWMEHGALDYVECVGDDLNIKDMLSFNTLAKVEGDEQVIFAWIRYESKAHRDAVNAKVMADPRIQEMCPLSGNEMPFDCKRMAYGGFQAIVESGS